MVNEKIDDIINSKDFIKRIKEISNGDENKYRLGQIMISLYKFCWENKIDFDEITVEKAKELFPNLNIDKTITVSSDKNEYNLYSLYFILKNDNEEIEYLIAAVFHELIHIFQHFTSSKFFKGELTKNTREQQAQMGSYVLCKMFNINKMDDYSIKYMEYFELNDNNVYGTVNDIIDTVKYIYNGLIKNMEK